MAWHTLSDNGSFKVDWKEGGSSVRITTPTAPMWQYKLSEEMTINQLEEIIQAHGPNMDVQDVEFLINAGRCVEEWLNWAPSDLERYGEVGVTF